MKKFGVTLVASAMLAAANLPGQAAGVPAGVLGYWTEPGGSVIHVERCRDAICATIVAVSKKEPYTVDGQNPDAALRTRPLCDLRIGYDFRQQDPMHLTDGKLYDPKSGKTYKGAIESDGNTLKLRGYVGFKAFGRSETWTRTTASNATCPKPVTKG